MGDHRPRRDGDEEGIYSTLWSQGQDQPVRLPVGHLDGRPPRDRGRGRAAQPGPQPSTSGRSSWPGPTRTSAAASSQRPLRRPPRPGRPSVARPGPQNDPAIRAFDSFYADEGTAQLHRPGPAPRAARPLHDLAFNLRWSWDERSRDLFRWLDPDAWEESGHDPVALLGLVRRERLESMPRTPASSFMAEVHAELARYLETTGGSRSARRPRCAAWPTSPPSSGSPRPSRSTRAASGCWPATTSRRPAASASRSPASASSTGRATSASSSTSTAGSRSATPASTPTAWPSTWWRRPRSTVDLAGVPLTAQVWGPRSAGSPLYLLDADMEENDAAGRSVTDRLYAGDTEHRIRQEILLGIGGVRALQAAGKPPDLPHQRGPRRVPRPRADPPAGGQGRPQLPRGAGGGAGRDRLHHPHPRPGRDRPVPPGDHGALLQALRRGVRIPFTDLMALGHEPAPAPRPPSTWP